LISFTTCNHWKNILYHEGSAHDIAHNVLFGYWK